MIHLNRLFDVGYDLTPTIVATIVVIGLVIRDRFRRPPPRGRGILR